jgi:fatty acid desaturase
MLPAPELLTTPVGGGPILANGRAEAGLREQLRRIPTFQNTVAVMSVWIQAAAVLALVAWIGPWMWLPGLLLLGRTHAQLAALMHEAAHRLLFRNRRVNDSVGRWVLGYPSFAATDAYRRVHMAHHRQEFGPDEPDLPLYVGYPITKASLRRKLVRDATGQTGWKLMKAQLQGFRSPDRRVRRTVWSILAVQLVLFGLMTLAGYPILYVLWVGSYFTVWRVINRLRSIAEHGGMQASADRRETTHSVVQHWLARCFLVPYHIGWHLAHHVDSGVPWRNLPRYHQLLREYGYVTPGLEYPSYPALWRKLASRPRAAAPAATTDAAA